MLQYKLFQYTPFKSKTDVPLGILFHEPSLDYREFRYTVSLSQFETQFPEFDIKMIEKLLAGIKDQVDSVESFDIEDFTRFYLNDFHFSDLKLEECGDLDSTIERISKDYLRY